MQGDHIGGRGECGDLLLQGLPLLPKTRQDSPCILFRQQTLDQVVPRPFVLKYVPTGNPYIDEYRSVISLLKYIPKGKVQS